jgi:hypothetical protein
MHRISLTTDLSDLLGKSVEQICLGLHQVILRFDKDLYISIEGQFSIGDKSFKGDRRGDCRVAANDFAKLIGCNILSATVPSEDSVVIMFSNGMTLSAFDSSDHYESFQIKLPNQLIVV